MNRSFVFLLIVVVAVGISLKLLSDLRGENKPHPTDDFVAPSPGMAPSLPALPATPVSPEKSAAIHSMDGAIQEFEQAVKQSTDAEELRNISSLLERLGEVSKRMQRPDADPAHELQEIREIRAALRQYAPRTITVPADGTVLPPVLVPAAPAVPVVPAIPAPAVPANQPQQVPGLKKA